MTQDQEFTFLSSPETRKLVHKLLNATIGHDPVDALYDAECAVIILKARLERLQGGF